MAGATGTGPTTVRINAGNAVIHGDLHQGLTSLDLDLMLRSAKLNNGHTGHRSASPCCCVIPTVRQAIAHQQVIF